jgi:polyvinyl alcohol dehydrogenase (cytochrome)
MSPQSIYRALKDGKMKDQAASLSDADKVAVAEFLTRRKIGAATEAPEPPACKGPAAKFDFNDTPPFSNWGLAPGNTRFVPAKAAGLNAGNAAKLHLKWAVSFPNAIQVRSEPTLGGGAIYLGNHNGGVYAIDRKSGCARWIYQAGSEVRNGVAISSWKVGDHGAKPMVYFGDIFGFVYAVDAQTGQLVWRTRADDHPNASITGGASLDGDTLYVPVSTLEGIRASDPHYECCTSRGAVVAFNAATGAVKWKTYTTDTPTLTGTNARGAKQYGPSGASVWNTPTLDLKRRQLTVGTAENASSPASATSDAVIAMDLDTGKVKWVYQALAGDAMNNGCLAPDKANCPKENGPDFDVGGAGTMLVTLADGRDFVIAGQKSGHVHALDPDTGKLVWQAKPGRGGMMGGVHFGMAANKQFLFIPINDGPDGRNYDEPPHPGIYALDPATGKTVWSIAANQTDCGSRKDCLIGYTQAITATPDVVIAGTNAAWLRVFDAKSGKVLWETDTRKPFATVNGGEQKGGSFGGASGPLVYRSMVFASSGYSLAGATPGNLLLAFDTK